MTIVPATMEHFVAMYGEPPKFTMRGFAAVDVDRVLGVIGYYMIDNTTVVSMRVTDSLLRTPRVFIQGWKKLMPLLGSCAYAMCDPNIGKAASFMEHFGFVPLGDGVHRWTK